MKLEKGDSVIATVMRPVANTRLVKECVVDKETGVHTVSYQSGHTEQFPAHMIVGVMRIGSMVRIETFEMVASNIFKEAVYTGRVVRNGIVYVAIRTAPKEPISFFMKESIKLQRHEV